MHESIEMWDFEGAICESLDQPPREANIGEDCFDQATLGIESLFENKLVDLLGVERMLR